MGVALQGIEVVALTLPDRSPVARMTKAVTAATIITENRATRLRLG